MEIVVKTEEDGTFTTSNGTFEVVMHGDEPRKALSPMETLLGAVASCSAVDVVEILKKRRKSFQELNIFVKGHRRKAPYPRIFTQIDLHFRLVSETVKCDELLKNVNLSLEKYCSVAGMLRGNCEIVASAEVVQP